MANLDIPQGKVGQAKMYGKEVVRVINALKIGGYYYDFTGENYSRMKKMVQIFRTVFLGTVCLANFVAIYYCGFTESLNGDLVFLPISTLMFFYAFALAFKQREMKRYFVDLDKCLNTIRHPWEIEILNKYSKYAWGKADGVQHLITIVAAGYCFLPALADGILNLVGSEVIIRVPNPVSGFVTKNIRDIKHYFSLATLCVWVYFSVFTFCNFIASFIASTMYSFVMMRILKTYIVSDMKSISPSNKGMSEEKRHLIIREYLTRHQNVLRLTLRQNELFSFICALQNILISTCMCLFLYGAIKTFLLVDPLVQCTQIIGFVIFTIMGFSFCVMGELVENESNEVFKELYNIPWFECTPKVRKDFNMILRQARKPIGISYRGVSSLNMRRFMEIVHTSYSFFMLLKSMETKT